MLNYSYSRLTHVASRGEDHEVFYSSWYGPRPAMSREKPIIRSFLCVVCPSLKGLGFLFTKFQRIYQIISSFIFFNSYVCYGFFSIP